MKTEMKQNTISRMTKVALVAVIGSAIGVTTSRPVIALKSNFREDTNPIAESRPAPELLGKQWLNTAKNNPPKLASRKGKVTLVHFWTLGCINCKHNLPAYNHLQKKFAGRGVEVIGVHTPETPGESKFANVRSSIKKWGITYPVLVDNDNTNWNRWHQQFWPTAYLIDRTGKIRYRWEGELNFGGQQGERTLGEKIQALLDEK